MNQQQPFRPKDILDKCCAICDALEAAQTPADDDVVAKVGRVTATIGPGHPGEVRIPVRGGSEDYLAVAAHADDKIALNDTVVVVALHLPRTVVVRAHQKEP